MKPESTEPGNTTPDPEVAQDPAVENAATDSLFRRFHGALGPVAAGLILDFIDLATFGPIGLYLGFFIGAVAGWWIGSLESCRRPAKIALAVASAIYITIPVHRAAPDRDHRRRHGAVPPGSSSIGDCVFGRTAIGDTDAAG